MGRSFKVSLRTALGAGAVMAITSAPAAAQTRVDVGVWLPNVGARVVVGAPRPVYVPAPVYRAPVYAPVYVPARPVYVPVDPYYPYYAEPFYGRPGKAARAYNRDLRRAERDYRKDFRRAQRDYQRDRQRADRDRRRR